MKEHSTYLHCLEARMEKAHSDEVLWGIVVDP